MANHVKVIICNTEYAIVSQESPEYVRNLAQMLDGTLEELMQADPSISVTKALVLCAISYLDSATKAEASTDNLREQIQTYLEESTDARGESNDLKREIASLKKENQQLKAQLLESSMPENYKEPSV